MYQPGIDLVVINYQTPRDLGHFLASYEMHKPDLPHSLVVGNVDPLSDDTDVAMKGPGTVFHTDTNVGYARAVNYATMLGDAEVIGIFNADTRFTENVVNDCYNALVSNESWGILGPRQIDDVGKITHGGFFGTNVQPQERGFHHRNSEQYADIRDDATTVSGSAYFIKRTVWDELLACPIYQAFDPEAQGAFLPTPHYFEEAFCSYHARAHFYKVVYYGAATMIHQWHRASPRGGPADRKLRVSREIFRLACEAHGIEHA